MARVTSRLRSRIELFRREGIKKRLKWYATPSGLLLTVSAVLIAIGFWGHPVVGGSGVGLLFLFLGYRFNRERGIAKSLIIDSNDELQTELRALKAAVDASVVNFEGLQSMARRTRRTVNQELASRLHSQELALADQASRLDSHLTDFNAAEAAKVQRDKLLLALDYRFRQASDQFRSSAKGNAESIETIRAELTVMVRNEQVARSKAIDDLRHLELSELSDKVAQLTQDVGGWSEEIPDLSAAVNELTGTIAEQRNEGSDLANRLLGLDDALSGFDETLRTLSDTHGSRFEDVDSQVLALVDQLEDVRSKLLSSSDSFEHRILTANHRLRAVEDEVATMSGASTGTATSPGPTPNQIAEPALAEAPGTTVPSPSRIVDLIDGVESGRIPLEDVSDKFPDDVTGFSGRKFRTLVAHLVGELSELGEYLEIGVFRGKTLCTSAAMNPNVHHVGVDNFSYKGGQDNRHAFEEAVSQMGLSNVELLESDLFDWLPARSQSNRRDVAVYYFDASHDYRSQLLALLHGANIVVPGGVMIVDDCNYSHVRAATFDFCELHTDWALLFERYTQGHPNGADEDVRLEMDEGWWNGVHLLMHDPEHRITRLHRQSYPSERRFFLEQHRMENCVTDSVVSRLAGTTV